ncbi:BnaAnng25800D [Brassica napus]|uniref:DNA-directed RNA polymerase III subunit RPC10 n=2 Tax=Brassica TaxID=3705 RepID=A0A078JNC7_BRANA|nr:BnaAnng25800D [Brassica napus]
MTAEVAIRHITDALKMINISGPLKFFVYVASTSVSIIHVNFYKWKDVFDWEIGSLGEAFLLRLIEMEFCPTCGNLLRYGQSQFFCSTCPYIARIERQVEIKKKQLLVKKSIDPVVKKDDIPKGPETEAPCPRCGHDKAYFKTMQIRSADEPESRFYRCVKCEQTWREE